ncbi:MAG: biotin synthase BioB, partial [Planctomycetota bacterium]
MNRQATDSAVVADTASPTCWLELAESVLEGREISEADARAMLAAPDDQLLDIMAAAFRIRRRYFGRTVQLYFLMNAKSGLCPEDCSYCSQSKVSDAEIPRYNLLNRRQLMEGAAAAAG